MSHVACQSLDTGRPGFGPERRELVVHGYDAALYLQLVNANPGIPGLKILNPGIPGLRKTFYY